MHHTLPLCVRICVSSSEPIQHCRKMKATSQRQTYRDALVSHSPFLSGINQPGMDDVPNSFWGYCMDIMSPEPCRIGICFDYCTTWTLLLGQGGWEMSYTLEMNWIVKSWQILSRYYQGCFEYINISILFSSSFAASQSW